MKNLCDILLQKPFAEMAQELLKNDKFQGKLKKFLGEISKPKGSMMLKTLWHSFYALTHCMRVLE